MKMKKICYIYNENFEDKHTTIKDILNLDIIIIIKVNKKALHIVYVI